jgi:hypothetical protein
MQRNKTWAALVLAALQFAAAQGFAADVGKRKDAPAHVELIPGTTLHRVRLTARAAERLGIQTVTLREGAVARTKVVAAAVLEDNEVDRLGLRPAATHEPSLGKSLAEDLAGSSGSAVLVRSSEDVPEVTSAWVRAFPTSDVERLSRREAAHIMPLARDGQATRLRAEPASSHLMDHQGGLYYVVESGKNRLTSKQRVLIELPYKGTTRKSVPFSSIIYNERGEPWVYTRPEALTYVRHRVEIDYINGDVALLKDGPPAGTEVVAVGASLLLGAEMKIGH